MPIKAVIFDFGGVLVRHRFIDKYKVLAKKLKRPYTAVSRARHRHDPALKTGKMHVSKFLRCFAQELHVPVTRLTEKLTETVKQDAQTRTALFIAAQALHKQGYIVALLSNTGPVTAHFNRQIGLYDFFSPCILSCDCYCEKPNTKIYHIALHKINAAPSECIFIDNRVRNLVPAKKLGMHTIKYKNTRQVLHELKRIGVRWRQY